jgi:hypothetical protein
LKHSLEARIREAVGEARTGYSTRLALLAQLVEHLHGKEGVDGSSPSEGFAKALDTAPFLCSPLPNEAASRPFWKADGKSDAPGTIEA